MSRHHICQSALPLLFAVAGAGFVVADAASARPPSPGAAARGGAGMPATAPAIRIIDAEAHCDGQRADRPRRERTWHNARS